MSRKSVGLVFQAVGLIAGFSSSASHHRSAALMMAYTEIEILRGRPELGQNTVSFYTAEGDEVVPLANGDTFDAFTQTEGSPYPTAIRQSMFIVTVHTVPRQNVVALLLSSLAMQIPGSGSSAHILGSPSRRPAYQSGSLWRWPSGR